MASACVQRRLPSSWRNRSYFSLRCVACVWDGQRAGCSVLGHAAVCHVSGLVRRVFVLGSAFSFSPSEPSDPDSVHGLLVFCHFRKLDGNSSLLVDQTSTFFSWKPCRSGSSLRPRSECSHLVSRTAEWGHAGKVVLPHWAEPGRANSPSLWGSWSLAHPTQCLRFGFLLRQWVTFSPIFWDPELFIFLTPVFTPCVKWHHSTPIDSRNEPERGAVPGHGTRDVCG